MAFSIVQKTHVNASSTTNTSITLSGVTAGDLIVFMPCNNNNVTVSAGPTDTNGTVSAALGFGYGNTSGSNYAGTGIYYVPNCASGTHTISMTFSGSGNMTFFMVEYSGAATASPFDVASTLNFANSSAYSTNNITPTNTGELLIAVGSMIGSSVTASSLTNSFSVQDSYSTAGPSGFWASVTDSSNTSINCAATLSASVGWAGAVAAFVPAVTATLLGQICL